MKIASFDWDEGNLGKLKKHKIPAEDIEDFLINYEMNCLVDHKHCSQELRFIVFGKFKRRDLFVAFTFRVKSGVLKIRVISARYMHKREVGKLYEEVKK